MCQLHGWIRQPAASYVDRPAQASRQPAPVAGPRSAPDFRASSALQLRAGQSSIQHRTWNAGSGRIRWSPAADRARTGRRSVEILQHRQQPPVTVVAFAAPTIPDDRWSGPACRLSGGSPALSVLAGAAGSRCRRIGFQSGGMHGLDPGRPSGQRLLPGAARRRLSRRLIPLADHCRLKSKPSGSRRGIFVQQGDRFGNQLGLVVFADAQPAADQQRPRPRAGSAALVARMRGKAITSY